MWSATVLLALLFLQKPDLQADGMKALDQQRYDDAIQIFSKILASDPKDYGAHFNLALAYTLTNRDAEAIPEYRKVLELQPGLYQAELNLGMVLLRQRQAAEAVPHLDAAMKKKPNEFSPALYSGDALLASGKFPEAEAAYKRASEINAKSALAEAGLARALAKQDRLADADPHFRKAAELDPGFRDALLELASLYEAKKQNAQAVSIYKDFPENPAARERMGELLLESGQVGDAIPQLEEAVAKSPTSANRYALAVAYMNSKQSAKAIPLLTAAIQAEPGNLALHMDLGRALRDQKMYAQAAQEFYTVTQRKPDSKDAWGDLAGMLILLGNDSQALAALDRLKQLGGEKPAHFYFRAMLFDRNKQIKPAIENYEKFLALSEGKSPDEEFKSRQRVRILKNELNRR
jgi:tetratricopeptide (TPR) repeat protein